MWLKILTSQLIHQIKLCTYYNFFDFRIEKGNPDATKTTDLKIRCGEHDLKSSETEILPHQDKKVETFTIHPFYSGSKTPLGMSMFLSNNFNIRNLYRSKLVILFMVRKKLYRHSLVSAVSKSPKSSF